MRFDPRFTVGPENRIDTRWIERPDALIEAAAPEAWTTTRVEAWLDWAEGLPTDAPAGAPESLATENPAPLLGGGPDLYARRLAAWGLALGVFPNENEAVAFRDQLASLCAAGRFAAAPQARFGARINPLLPDPARATIDPPPQIGGAAFKAAAQRLGAGRSASLGPCAAARLSAASLAVVRCEGPRNACGDPSQNQALARACLAARAAGASDEALADAIALGRSGFA